MKHVLRHVLSACLVIGLTTGMAWAQGGASAQISGTVTDESGAVLPGVDVTMTQTNTGLKRNTVTDTSGFYTLTNLPIGPYTLEVSLAGFRTYAQTGIVLQVNASPSINVKLSIGEVAETISVQGEAPLVDTRRAGVGTVIENERIIQLPLDGRNPTMLIELAGAAVNVATEGASTRSWQGSAGGQGIAVAGGTTMSTAYTLDGTMHNNPYDNLQLPLPFPDALQEFRVQTGALDASAGVHSAASVNAVTKSGTNVYHGDIFEFWRNKRFNATNAFAAIGPDGKRRDDGLNRNQFGGTLGGPLITNRLFFFGAYQGTIIRQTPTDNTAFVPTPAMLAGDFTALTSPPCTAQPITLSAPFSGNRIDPARFSPAAVRLAARLPASTDPCGRVTFGRAQNVDESQPIGRVDFQWKPNHTIFGRYLLTSYSTPPALASSDNLLTSQFGGFDNLAQSLTLGETWVINSSMVNSLRFAWNNTDVHRIHEGYFSAPELGIDIFSYLDDYFILSAPGAFTVGSGINNEARFKTTTFQVSDDLTMLRGSHQFSFGTNIARWDSFSTAHVRSPGTFNLTSQFTGHVLSDFLMGNVAQFLQAAPNFLDMYQWYVGVYAADTWRVSPKVTLTYGLRWEPFFPQQLPNGYIYNFSLDRFNQGIKSDIFLNAPAGFVYPGDEEFVGGFSGMHKKWANFAPRVGATWDPRGDGRLIARGGYSLSYDFVTGQYHLNTSVAPPWGAEVRLTGVSLDAPYRNNPGGNPFPRSFDANTPFPAFGSFLAVDPDTANPRQHSWNVGFEQQIGPNMAVSATYIGNHVENLWNMKALNPGVFLGTAPCTINTSTGPVNYPVCSTDANLPQRRRLSLQNPQASAAIGHLDAHDPSGRQNYHGLLLDFRRRSANGVSFSGNYTLSKCEGHPTQTLPNVGTGWADPENPDFDYGPCNSDRRHLVNLTAGVQTPDFDNTALRAVASGWRVNGILRTQSGAPLNITTGQDRTMTGVTNNQRANQILDDGYGDKSWNNWLNRAAFAQPALGTLGNSERGGFRGPGRWQVDMILARLIRFAGTQQIELRLETFNLTNNVILDNPNGNSGVPGTTDINLSNANFGRILRTAPNTTPRVLQFGIKYGF